MSQHAFARSFRDLIVYRKATAVAKTVFEKTRRFPSEERYSLTDQVRRSSRSIGAQIAEGWAKRKYPNHFTSKLTDADGEQNETQHWVDVAADCGYLTAEEAAVLSSELREIGCMLQRMIDLADQFCGERYGEVREASASYGTSDSFFTDTSSSSPIPLNTEH